MGIGKRIKEARENLNITQAQLAKVIGITPSAITNYENETSHPKESILYKLMDALKVDANYLFQDSIQLNAFEITLSEQTHIKKYRQLDEYGKKAVDTTLLNEFDRCNQDLRFINYEDAMEFMKSRPMYAMGGMDLDRMDQEKLIKWANDFWELEQEAKQYLD